MLPSFAFKRLTKFLEQNILESLVSNNLHPRIKNCEHVVCVLVPRVPEKVLMRGLANLWSKSPAIVDTIKVTTPATARRRTTIEAKKWKRMMCYRVCRKVSTSLRSSHCSSNEIAYSSHLHQAQHHSQRSIRKQKSFPRNVQQTVLSSPQWVSVFDNRFALVSQKRKYFL